MRTGSRAAIIIIAGVIALSAALAPSQNEPAHPPAILDQGDFFSPQAIGAAEHRAAVIKNETGTDVLVLTFVSIPEAKASELESKGKDRFFSDWLIELAARHKTHGIVILAVDHPRHLEIGVQKSLLEHDFAFRDRDALRDLLVDRFKRREFDRGLNDAMYLILDRIGENHRAAGDHRN